MLSNKNIQTLFENLGGTFVSTPQEIIKKWQLVEVLIFDWDGVFNNGSKSTGAGSTYTEADSMGINLLRYNYWRKKGKVLTCFIVSGANNQTAIDFAEREHFNRVFTNQTNKLNCLKFIRSTLNIENQQICFFFDDVIDLGLAQKCSLSFCIKRKASPMFNNFVRTNKISDYTTGNEGGRHAIREVAEMLLGLEKKYDEIIKERFTFSEEYMHYLEQRNSITVVKKTS